MTFHPLFPCVLRFADITWSKGNDAITFRNWANLGPGRVISALTNKIASIKFSTNQEALLRILLHTKNGLMRPRVLAAAMDLFCFYRGRLLPERCAFCDL